MSRFKKKRSNGDAAAALFTLPALLVLYPHHRPLRKKPTLQYETDEGTGVMEYEGTGVME